MDRRKKSKREAIMMLGLNGGTTMENADLVTDVNVSEKVGYDVLEISAPKLEDFLSQNSLTQLKDVFKNSKIKPYSITSIPALENITFQDKNKFLEIREKTLQFSEIANKIRCKYIVVGPSPYPKGAKQKEILKESVSVLKELSKISLQYNVGLGFEFIGTTECSVNNLKDCWQIVKHVDLKNIGLVLDTFHFYISESSFDSIKEVNPDKIFIFHISDSEDRPKKKLKDEHRLLPGEGVIPLTKIATNLKIIGYDKLVSVELLRPEYWQWEPEKLAKVAKEKTLAVLRGIYF